MAGTLRVRSWEVRRRRRAGGHRRYDKSAPPDSRGPASSGAPQAPSGDRPEDRSRHEDEEREAAGQIALGFIGKLASEYKDQIAYNPEFGVQVLPPLTGEVVHSLRYDRIVNGIPYVDNFIQVEVDSEGHVKGYSLVWDDTVTFPKVETKLTAEQADEKLTEIAESAINVEEAEAEGSQTGSRRR